MCVIIVCPKGVKIPSLNELRAAFATNPDGAGFVTKSIHYKSLHFGAFYRQLKKRDINEDCIIHFRYATHGSVCVKNCHPFYNKRVWFAHNGVLSIKSVNDKTDSQIYFDNVVRPMITEFGINSLVFKTEMQRVAYSHGSKFAILKDGKAHLYGRFEMIDGRYYSNTRHFYRMKKEKYYNMCV